MKFRSREDRGTIMNRTNYAVDRLSAPGTLTPQISDAVLRQEALASFSDGLRTHMLRVYNYMTIGLVVSAAVAFFAAQSQDLIMLLMGNQIARFGIMFLPMPFAMVIQARGTSAAGAQFWFWVFSAVMGLVLGAITGLYMKLGLHTALTILRVFLVTASMFAGASLFGYVTRRDMSGWGGTLGMMSWGLLVAIAVNMFFFESGTAGLIISLVGVVIFTGMTAYETQAIKFTYVEGVSEGDGNQKLAVMGAFQLYLCFVNLFLFLLRIFASSRE
jgi:FtsH-binding integral membrane protein